MRQYARHTKRGRVDCEPKGSQPPLSPWGVAAPRGMVKMRMHTAPEARVHTISGSADFRFMRKYARHIVNRLALGRPASGQWAGPGRSKKCEPKGSHRISQPTGHLARRGWRRNAQKEPSEARLPLFSRSRRFKIHPSGLWPTSERSRPE